MVRLVLQIWLITSLKQSEHNEESEQKFNALMQRKIWKDNILSLKTNHDEHIVPSQATSFRYTLYCYSFRKFHSLTSRGVYRRVTVYKLEKPKRLTMKFILYPRLGFQDLDSKCHVLF